MTDERIKLKKELSAEFNKPKARNVGKNGAKYYKGTPVDKVPVRDAGRIADLHAALNDTNMATPRKKAEAKKADPARKARMKAKALARKGKTVEYVPRWKK